MNAPWKPGVRDPFAAYLCDDTSVETLRAVAIEQGWNPDRIARGGLRHGVQALSVSASPQILLVDLAESGDPLADINALAEVCEPGTVVIAIGQVNDVRLYRDLVASGIQDYLLKPLHPHMLRDAFAQAQAVLNTPRSVEQQPERPHGAVAVIGARGGSGASSVAIALAWLLAERETRSTALLDLDIHFGTGALGLDLEPGRGLTDAIDNPSRIDGLFIERAMVRASDKLAILSAETPINSPLVTDGAAFYQLQEEIRAAFEQMVIDLPRHMLVQHPALVTDVQAVVIVAELTLAAARDTIRLLAWCRTHAPATHVHLVLNKVPATPTEISRKDFETTVERAVDLALPFDPKLAVQAAKLGKSLAETNRGGKIGGALADLARTLAGTGDAEPDAKARRGGKLAALLAKRAKP